MLRPPLVVLVVLIGLLVPAICSAAAPAALLGLQTAAAAAPAQAPPAPADPADAVRRLAEQEIARQHAAPELTSTPVLVSLRVAGDWAIVDLYRVPKHTPQRPSAAPELWVARRVGDTWQLALPSSPDYPVQLQGVPVTLLDPLARQMALDRTQSGLRPAGAAALGGYRMPWLADEAAYVTQPYGAHGLGQIDFWIPSATILAAKAGEVVYVNNGNTLAGCSSEFARYNNVVVVRHAAGEYTLYLHVATGSVPQAIKAQLAAQGYAPVAQGAPIAQQGNAGYTCGGDGKHLHLSSTADYFVYNAPDALDADGDGDHDEPVFTAWARTHHAVDFVEATYDQLAAWPFETPIVSQNRGDPCAGKASSGAVLFSGAGCQAASEALAGETLPIDLPALGWNDRIRSISVAPGWSVRLYAHVARLGASRCLAAPTADFGPLTYDGGSVALDRSASSLQVFHSPDCTPAPLQLGLAAAPPAVVDASGRVEVTFTLTTTGVVDARMQRRTFAFQAPPASPAVAYTTTSFVDLLAPAGEAANWPALDEVPSSLLTAWWSRPPDEGQLAAEFAGEDAIGRPISATVVLPLVLDGCGDPGEWNGAAEQATPLLLGSTATGVVCPAGDVDFYRFDAAAGQSMAAWVEAAADGSPLDAALTLLDGDGVTALATSDDAAGTFDPYLAHSLSHDGTYYLRVAGGTAAGGHAYTYRLRLTAGDGEPPPCQNPADGYEPDDSPAASSALAVDGSVATHTFHVAGDEDWFAFDAVLGLTYTLGVEARLIDPALTLFDQDGSTALASAGAPGSRVAQVEWVPEASGRYYGRVRALDAQQGGCTTRYSVAISAADLAAPLLTIGVEGQTSITNRRAVTLTLTVSDVGTGVDGIQLANVSTFSASGWSPVLTAMPWQLTPGDGVKTVFGRVRDRAGNPSPVVTGTILLDTTSPVAQVSMVGNVTTLFAPQAAVQIETVPDAIAMRFRVDDGDWGEWLALADVATVDLPNRPGTLRIDLQVRDGASNQSAVSSVSVDYVTPVAFLPLLRR